MKINSSHDYNLYTCKVTFLILCMCFLNGKVFTQDAYPFEVPSTITAELDVKTGSQDTFKNPLLGYNIFGFESSADKDFVRKFDPITIRFPHGLFSNWYDWRTDGTRVFGTETFDYIFRDRETRSVKVDQLSTINTFSRLDRKVGIDGLEQLNRERKIGESKGFDMVWTFNMSADAEVGASIDDAPETLAFYDNLISRGLEVKDVELGNENFYPGQRSSFIPDASDYVVRAKAMGQALKSRDPNIKVSIPLLRRGSFVDPNWNSKLTEDSSYFDAVTVHTYIGADPDNADNSDEAYGTALTARKSLASSTNDFVRPFSAKPVWLTEWGVSSGGANAASALGMADCYLFMAENQDIYQRANWFSVNGKLNSFVAFTENPNGSKDQVKYPLEKTTYGSTHEILKSVLANSVMLGATMTTLELEPGVDAVTARAVTKDGKTIVLVLNLTDQPVPFTLKIDGELYTQPFLHKAMQFVSVDEKREIPFDDEPLSIIKVGSGAIVLPPLSISTVSLGDDVNSQPPTVMLTSPSSFSSYDLGEVISLEATATDGNGTITQVEFKIDNVLIGTVDTVAPYEGTFTPTVAGTYRVSATATDNDGLSTESYNLINVLVKEPVAQAPYGDRNSIPGVLEAEEYDLGGQDTAYNDKSPENTGNADFRTEEGVDISLSDERIVTVDNNFGEWTEFTVIVSDSTTYNFEWTYATRRPNAGLSVELMGQGLIIDRIDLPSTGSFTTYLTVSADSISLPAGEHVLRFRIIDGGFNVDKVVITSNAEQLPYAGIIQIPGRLEVENYDIGGPGISYQDNDAGNAFEIYRMDDVDIGEGGTGFVTGFNATGEWQEYTINVANADYYKLDFAYASGRAGGGAIGIILPDGKRNTSVSSLDSSKATSRQTNNLLILDSVYLDTIISNFNLPKTANWQTYEVMTLDSVYFNVGKQVIRVFVASAAYNIDYIDFQPYSTVSNRNFSTAKPLMVYPNPSGNGRFFLEESEIWTVYSLSGQMVSQGSGREVDISNFARATYFLRTASGIGKIIYQ